MATSPDGKGGRRALPSSALLLALACALSAAQPRVATSQRAPTAPDSVLTAGPRDTAFTQWRAEVREHGRFGSSFLLMGQRYQVLVVTPMALDVLAPDSLVVRHARGCQPVLQYPDAVIDSAAAMRPWAAFDSAAAARPTVAFTILPADPVRIDCARGQLARFAAITRGAVFGVPPAYNPVYDATRAELRRDGELIPEVLLGSAPVRKHAIGAVVEDDTRQVRLYVPVDAFAPYDDGRTADLSLFVSSPVDDAPDILRVPPELARAVWAQFQPWRARQLGHDGARPLDALTLEFPEPRDTVLRRAHAEFRAGAWGLATSTVLGRLARTPLPRAPEVRDGMVLGAATFVAYGYDEDATALLTDVAAFYPCLRMTAGAPDEMHRILDRVRPQARCTSLRLPLVAAAGLVPGGGQIITPGRRAFGQTLLLATVGAFAAAQGLHAYSRSAYDDYLANTGSTSTPAAADYRRADLTRNIGNAMTIGAISVWSYAAIEGVFMEWRHKRRIADVQDVGARRRSR
ncbi:hypothetical protein Strain138_002917 [Pseudogemmatithrix spongiicola]|uniref:DUF5683 domain-containing protein n=1 Tax=Pseudogemmatithrix spongiicola TaxID=3062599 RepID=A0AA49JXU4_9BACT|nr:hypothetical protein Strain138_002917 [Gemmatimonadaceae bacterium 'strain 138']WKW16499.1 hypothetical protein Strain318_002915 [Gemmatimonadaceae bacterium 'strain 318']